MGEASILLVRTIQKKKRLFFLKRSWQLIRIWQSREQLLVIGFRRSF